MRSLLGTLGLVAVGVVIFALVARAMGFSVNLGWTLIVSLGLTLLLNLVTGALRRGGR
jgi:hypothetical protein